MNAVRRVKTDPGMMMLGVVPIKEQLAESAGRPKTLAIAMVRVVSPK